MSEWQDISTAPKDGTIVDIWSKEHGRCTNMYRVDRGKGNVFYAPAICGLCRVDDATHWMNITRPEK